MALSKLAVKRLTTLALFMERLPKSAERHFDMVHFFRHRGTHKHGFGKTISRKALTACGTSACAYGWAGTIPAFKKAGLVIPLTTYDRLTIGDVSTAPGNFFDLNGAQEAALFYNFSLKTPKEWAARCRRLIQENGRA